MHRGRRGARTQARFALRRKKPALHLPSFDRWRPEEDRILADPPADHGIIVPCAGCPEESSAFRINGNEHRCRASALPHTLFKVQLFQAQSYTHSPRCPGNMPRRHPPRFLLVCHRARARRLWASRPNRGSIAEGDPMRPRAASSAASLSSPPL